MKKRSATKKQVPSKINSGRLSLGTSKTVRRLSELVTVYQDLERTLKGVKKNSYLESGSSLMQINIQKLITQLSKSKRNIERKISSTLVFEKTQLIQHLDKWAPRLGRKVSKRSFNSKVNTQVTQ